MTPEGHRFFTALPDPQPLISPEQAASDRAHFLESAKQGRKTRRKTAAIKRERESMQETARIMKGAGANYTQIASNLGVTKQTVSHWFREAA